MITALALKAVGALVHVIFLPLSVLAIPDWGPTILEYTGPAAVTLGGFHNFVAVHAIANCVLFALGVFGLTVGVKVARICISLFTGGGGSAG